jgi:hypothetical protein
MNNKTPCEIAFWYILPSIRRELVKSMIKEGYKRKNIAKTLGISEASVSYYLKSKRGNKYKFNKKELAEIEKVARNLVKNKNNLTLETCKLCSMFKKSLLEK